MSHYPSPCDSQRYIRVTRPASTATLLERREWNYKALKRQKERW